MKSKFQNLDFGSVEVLSQEQQNKVKGGYITYGQAGGSNLLWPYTPPYNGNPPGTLPPIPPTGVPGNPGGGEMCYKNALTGAFSKDPDFSQGGWLPTSSGCNK
jgi:hypothetical protein